jgi:hypothetical protein
MKPDRRQIPDRRKRDTFYRSPDRRTEQPNGRRWQSSDRRKSRPRTREWDALYSHVRFCRDATGAETVRVDSAYWRTIQSKFPRASCFVVDNSILVLPPLSWTPPQDAPKSSPFHYLLGPGDLYINGEKVGTCKNMTVEIPARDFAPHGTAVQDSRFGPVQVFAETVEVDAKADEDLSIGDATPTTFGERYFAKKAKEFESQCEALQRSRTRMRNALATLRFGESGKPTAELVERLVRDADEQTATLAKWQRVKDYVQQSNLGLVGQNYDEIIIGSLKTKRGLELALDASEANVLRLSNDLRTLEARLERERTRNKDARLRLADKGMEWVASYTTRAGLRFVHALATCKPDFARATGRTTRMLDAAIDEFARGGKVAIAVRYSDRDRIWDELKERFRTSTAYSHHARVSRFGIEDRDRGGRIQVVNLPTDIDMIERDLGENRPGFLTMIDHHSAETMFQERYPRLWAETQR